MSKKILFVTGTRADFGKMKSVITAVSGVFNVEIFVTGMHLMTRFGSTWNEVRDLGIGQIFPFVNQSETDSMPSILAKTIQGLSDFVRESKPDLIFVHGDRIETLAGAVVGTLTNTLVGHIEGGEISGTVDEMIRHAVSKLANYHFVSNEQARELLLQMGESDQRIFVVGSPDIDIMFSSSLPTLSEVVSRYEIPFEHYSIAILHPVVTEIEKLNSCASLFFQALQESHRKFILIEPNNDQGHEIISEEIDKLRTNSRFRIFPSMRFEYFLTLLKNSDFIIGNSSAGVREAPYYGVPCIDVGSRQEGRFDSSQIIKVDFHKSQILKAISNVSSHDRNVTMNFGIKGSSERIRNILLQDSFWSISTQKKFLKRSVSFGIQEDIT